jgi:hypothetical protein
MKCIACIVLVSLLACSNDYEENKMLNFDACIDRCAKSGQTIKTFEQGLSYVKCECQMQQ